MFVNAIAPFVLNSRLQPLMETPENRPDRYIINVSAMEGKFYRYKVRFVLQVVDFCGGKLLTFVCELQQDAESPTH